MPNTLVVSAHPDPQSFTAAWAGASVNAARALGHEVARSDLCAMGFDAVERAAHYGAQAPGFDVLKAQERAASGGALPGDVAAEMAKVRAARLIILHFPIWWFAPPAILKGWCERVLLHGALHSVDARFDSGLFRDTRVWFCVTTGASEAESGPDGKEGNVRMLLWPLAMTFRYLGMSVLEPKLLHGVHGYAKGADKAALEARLARALREQPSELAAINRRAVMPFNADSDFDGAGRLKPEAPGVTPFIVHPDRD